MVFGFGATAWAAASLAANFGVTGVVAGCTGLADAGADVDADEGVWVRPVRVFVAAGFGAFFIEGGGFVGGACFAALEAADLAE